ncbi:MAG: CREG family protein [Polyangiaceae bacterium]|jgi:hypothetical protein|nr:CREG family protein [Polyangiaceae bacterium]
MSGDSHASLARRLVQQARCGSLATLALDPAGFPFASLVAVADDGQGCPLMVISTLAEHTRHLLADPRASLLLWDEDPGADPLAAGRVTLVGPCQPVEDREVPQARQRFLEAHPEAKIYVDFADFRPYRLSPEAVRFVGGFGRMSWVDGAAYRAVSAG